LAKFFGLRKIPRMAGAAVPPGPQRVPGRREWLQVKKLQLPVEHWKEGWRAWIGVLAVEKQPVRTN
jgi:hypothetical protein